MDPFKAGAALHRPTPPGHISSAHCTEKDGARVRINATTHQEKETENTDKRDAEEEKKKRYTYFRKTEWCSSAIVQGAARQKMV